MRRNVAALVTACVAVVTLLLVQPAGAGGSLAGKKCSKEGLRKMSQGKEYICAKRKGKLVWMRVTSPGPSPEPSPSPSPSDPALPPISTFLTQPSDRLPADMATVDQTSPFLGTGALRPHAGIHINWSNRDGRWTIASAPSDFPAIYAIADGRVANVSADKPMGSHDAYDVLLEIATGVAGEAVIAAYSIEPFVPEPSPDFYQAFIVVKQGQRVKKGDVLAYMYVPPTSTGSTHLHLHLGSQAGILAPSIFTPEAVAAFAAEFGDRGGYENGVRLPACIGYKVSAEQNPYGTGARDCL